MMITAQNVWYLRGRLDHLASVQSLPVNARRYIIGRQSDCALSLPSPSVSSQHAEIVEREDRLYVIDLDSTNGTFLNGVRVHGTAQVEVGDLLQFADMAFRVCRETVEPTRQQTICNPEDLAETAFSLVQFDRLITQQRVIPHYQPLVRLPSKEVFGYEVLGRSKLVGLETPRAMFLAASQLNMEAELSHLMRVAGAVNSGTLPGAPALFLNTHPSEVVEFGLLDSLRDTRRDYPELDIVLEIHEASVTESESMRKLRNELNKLNIGLAYDDFGAGQSRLRDIIDVPPDYLKFDISLIHAIDSAPAKRQEMLASLVHSVVDMGIVALAEGVETKEEHEACLQIGFTTAQGYFYGRPVERPRAPLGDHDEVV